MMYISKSVFLVASLAALSFSSFGVEGSRTLKKTKKGSSPTPSPTPEPIFPPLPANFPDVDVTVVNGAANGVGGTTIVFAKGELVSPDGITPVNATLTISIEVTTVTPPQSIETVISTVQLCILSPFEGGCAIFQGSSLFPFSLESDVVPRIAAASSSGTGIFFYGQEIFIDIPEYVFQDPTGIECTITFTAPFRDLAERVDANFVLAKTVPGFIPPEGDEGPNMKGINLAIMNSFVWALKNTEDLLV